MSLNLIFIYLLLLLFYTSAQEFPGIITTQLIIKIINATLNLEFNSASEIDQDKFSKFLEFMVPINNYKISNFDYDFIGNRFQKSLTKFYLKKLEFIENKFDLLANGQEKKNFDKIFSNNAVKSIKHNVDFVIHRHHDKHLNKFHHYYLIDQVLAIITENWRFEPCGMTLWEKILDTYNLGTRGIIKAYTLIILSLKYKKIINSRILSYDRRIERTVDEYKKLIMRISKSTRHYMKEYNHYKNKVHWNCAPFEWKSGSHYANFTTMEMMFSDNKFLLTHKIYFNRYPRVSTNIQCADIENNEVVTGLKLEMHNNILYPVIQVGKLQNSSIKLSSVHWKPINFSSDNNDTVLINVFNNITYFKLGGIKLPPRHVATGVKFLLINDTVTLAVGGSKVSSDNNPRSLTKIRWFDEVNLDNCVEFFEIIDDDANADAAIEPFFDSRKLITYPPMPIGGIGLRQHLDGNNDIVVNKNNDEKLRIISPYFVNYDYLKFFTPEIFAEFHEIVF